MYKLLRRFIACAVALLPAAAHALCSCECVDGAPRTICTKVEEAAARPSLCGLDPPLCAPVGTPAPRVRYDPPPGARDCREAALAGAANESDPTLVKVCDTVEAPPTQ